MKTLPIYNIEKFKHLGEQKDFYTNTLKAHLAIHDFIKAPHKHNFYFIAIVIQGSGTHTIDFISYSVKPGSVFAIIPGQSHSWDLSENTEGYVLFHTKSFYNLYFPSRKIQDYPFFGSMHNSPTILVKEKSLKTAQQLFSEILNEYNNEYLLKSQRISVMLDLLYIDLTRLYLPKAIVTRKKHDYLVRIEKLESLIDAHFKEIRSPTQYAKMMFMSNKHLNRICKEVLNKTTSDLIMDRVLLEAKRLLVHSSLPVSEISEELGFFDVSYFSRLFKKRSGKTPLEFIKSFSSNKLDNPVN